MSLPAWRCSCLLATLLAVALIGAVMAYCVAALRTALEEAR